MTRKSFWDHFRDAMAFQITPLPQREGPMTNRARAIHHAQEAERLISGPVVNLDVDSMQQALLLTRAQVHASLAQAYASLPANDVE